MYEAEKAQTVLGEGEEHGEGEGLALVAATSPAGPKPAKGAAKVAGWMQAEQQALVELGGDSIVAVDDVSMFKGHLPPEWGENAPRKCSKCFEAPKRKFYGEFVGALQGAPNICTRSSLGALQGAPNTYVLSARPMSRMFDVRDQRQIMRKTNKKFCFV